MMNAAVSEVEPVVVAPPPESLSQRTNAVLDHAIEEIRHARALSDHELQKAIGAFRTIFTTVPVEMRSNVLLKQAWAVHQALEVVRSLDAAILHLQCEKRAPQSIPKLAA